MIFEQFWKSCLIGQSKSVKNYSITSRQCRLKCYRYCFHAPIYENGYDCRSNGLYVIEWGIEIQIEAENDLSALFGECSTTFRVQCLLLYVSLCVRCVCLMLNWIVFRTIHFGSIQSFKSYFFPACVIAFVSYYNQVNYCHFGRLFRKLRLSLLSMALFSIRSQYNTKKTTNDIIYLLYCAVLCCCVYPYTLLCSLYPVPSASYARVYRISLAWGSQFSHEIFMRDV